MEIWAVWIVCNSCRATHERLGQMRSAPRQKPSACSWVEEDQLPKKWMVWQMFSAGKLRFVLTLFSQSDSTCRSKAYQVIGKSIKPRNRSTCRVCVTESVTKVAMGAVEICRDFSCVCARTASEMIPTCVWHMRGVFAQDRGRGCCEILHDFFGSPGEFPKILRGFLNPPVGHLSDRISNFESPETRVARIFEIFDPGNSAPANSFQKWSGWETGVTMCSGGHMFGVTICSDCHRMPPAATGTGCHGYIIILDYTQVSCIIYIACIMLLYAFLRAFNALDYTYIGYI